MRRYLLMSSLLLIACSDDDAAPAADAQPDTAAVADTAPRQFTDLPFAPQLEVDFANMTATPGGVYVQDITAGRGAVAESGKQVTVHYKGWLPDGTLFEERPNQAGFGPSEFMLGVASPVPGLTEGISGMRVGGVRRIVIPAEQGYGLVGRPEGVPENSPLVFEVRLIRVE